HSGDVGGLKTQSYLQADIRFPLSVNLVVPGADPVAVGLAQQAAAQAEIQKIPWFPSDPQISFKSLVVEEGQAGARAQAAFIGINAGVVIVGIEIRDPALDTDFPRRPSYVLVQAKT